MVGRGVPEKEKFMGIVRLAEAIEEFFRFIGNMLTIAVGVPIELIKQQVLPERSPS